MLNGRCFLKKQFLPVPEVEVVAHLPTSLLSAMEAQPVAFDFETHGTNPMHGGIRSIGLANDAGCVAIDLEQLSPVDRKQLTQWLLKQRLVAHNMVFDGAWVFSKTGKMPIIEACTLSMYKVLSTEGFNGQQWGLKSAMEDILGWPESNEKDLYEWLRSNKMGKSEMAKAPWSILGKYNALDAAATWELFKYFSMVIEKNGMYHLKSFLSMELYTSIELVIEQQYHGMTIDLQQLSSYAVELDKEIESKRTEFLEHSEVKPLVKEYQDAVVAELRKAEPPRLTKTGKVAARYLKWEERVAKHSSQIDFNIDSPKHLQWLLYEKLQYSHNVRTDKGDMSVGKKALPYLGPLGKLLKEYRELRDRRKFVTSLAGVQKDGVFHPSVKIHATVTGRSGGGTIE